jgi:hypothetical protein
MTAHTLPPMRVGGVTSKLHDPHVRRLALVSVRQSHPHQVIEPVESAARQSAFVDRAVALGWARERGVVMDEAQGQSGQRMGTRVGVQRVWAEVSWDQVGPMLGLELSRLARSHTDWPP